MAEVNRLLYPRSKQMQYVLMLSLLRDPRNPLLLELGDNSRCSPMAAPAALRVNVCWSGGRGNYFVAGNNNNVLVATGDSRIIIGVTALARWGIDDEPLGGGGGREGDVFVFGGVSSVVAGDGIDVVVRRGGRVVAPERGGDVIDRTADGQLVHGGGDVLYGTPDGQLLRGVRPALRGGDEALRRVQAVQGRGNPLHGDRPVARPVPAGEKGDKFTAARGGRDGALGPWRRLLRSKWKSRAANCRRKGR
jgi:hypothetical protein